MNRVECALDNAGGKDNRVHPRIQASEPAAKQPVEFRGFTLSLKQFSNERCAVLLVTSASRITL